MRVNLAVTIGVPLLFAQLADYPNPGLGTKLLWFC